MMCIRGIFGLLSRRPAPKLRSQRVREHPRGKPRGGWTAVRAYSRFGRRAG